MPTAYLREQVDRRLTELYQRHRLGEDGDVASFYESGRGYYGPADAGRERDTFGVSFATDAGGVYAVGDCDMPFALQSLSKVFVYGLALEDQGRHKVLERVGVEPSGDAFNSIVFDERHHRPYNSMVNAGALVTSDLVSGKGPAGEAGAHPRPSAVVRRHRQPHGRLGHLRPRDADRRPQSGHGLPHAQRGHAVRGQEATLALYLQQCSVKVTCRQLAVMAATLANGCVNPVTGQRALPREHVRDVLSVMYTCGMYDAAGQWAYEIGVPAKSGVSGGILAAVPGKAGVGVFSPGLDEYGNSVRGVLVCREVSERLGLHVFATEGEDALADAARPDP
jgi:glutaminase